MLHRLLQSDHRLLCGEQHVNGIVVTFQDFNVVQPSTVTAGGESLVHIIDKLGSVRQVLDVWALSYLYDPTPSRLEADANDEDQALICHLGVMTL